MSIIDLWNEHEAASFPAECRGAEIEGIDLVQLDADVAGCVSTFLGSDQLEFERRHILKKCRGELEVVLKSLSGNKRDYYARLHKLAVLILESST